MATSDFPFIFSLHYSINNQTSVLHTDKIQKKTLKQLVNNINLVLYFFKNRIIENKKLLLFFLFFLGSFIYFIHPTRLTDFERHYFKAPDFTFSKKYLSISVLRI